MSTRPREADVMARGLSIAASPRRGVCRPTRAQFPWSALVRTDLNRPSGLPSRYLLGPLPAGNEPSGGELGLPACRSLEDYSKLSLSVINVDTFGGIHPADPRLALIESLWASK